jgi:hypothetical protein
MSSAPPLLPVETLLRVLRTAKLNGTSVLALAGLFAVLSAMGGDRLGALIGVVIAGAGAFELHGAGLLRQGVVKGVSWLVASQVYLLLAILVYAAWRLFNYDPELMRRVSEQALKTPEIQAKLLETGTSEEDMLRLVRLFYHLTYMILAVATFFYQGAMVLYYRRRRPAIEVALREIHGSA